jgi:rare lipoprotein A
MGFHKGACLQLAVLALLGAAPALADQATGLASFYRATPTGSERLTAAHRSLPFGTFVRVTRIDNGAHVVVRINDRGPFIAGRIIDLSLPAAEQIGMVGSGLARVRVEVVPVPAPRMIREGRLGDPAGPWQTHAE